MEIDNDRRLAIRKAYIDLLNQAKFRALGYIKTLDMLTNDLVVIKYRHGNPPEVVDYLRQFAEELGKMCPDGIKVVLCPEPHDIQSMPRDEAIKSLKEMAADVGCEVFDPREKIVFPKLSPEVTSKLTEACKRPQGELRPIFEALPSISIGGTRDGWTFIEMFVPIVSHIPGDAMYLNAFARIEGTKLLEWTTHPPACFQKHSHGQGVCCNPTE